MKVRKTIYISDDKIINKLKQVKNQSAYICSLILNDIDKPTCPYVTEEKVLQLIYQFINTNNIQTVKQVNTNDLKDSIMSALDI